MQNKKRKVLVIALIVGLIAIISLASLAYFTDSDEVTNVFTIGGVDMTLNDVDDQGQPFNDNPHAIVPGVPVAKIVSVTNNGDPSLVGNDAYVRTFIGVPEKLDSVLIKDFDYDHWNFDGADYIAEIDGVRYKVYQFTYKDILTAGQTTYPVLKSVTLDPKVDIKAGKLVVPNAEGGYEALDFDINALRELKVPVAMQAIQTGGFKDAYEAFDAGFNGCPWDQAAPEQDQQENPADISLFIKGADLNKPMNLVWNSPDGTGYNDIQFVIPAGTFSDPVEIYVDAGKSEDGPAEMWISFYKLDENGNRVMETSEDGEEYPVAINPNVTDDFKIVINSPYQFVGSDKLENLVGFELDTEDFFAWMNTETALYNSIVWPET